jgi:hypothetical protein
MLNSQQVILAMNQDANYSFAASGTNNASPNTLRGQVISGASVDLAELELPNPLRRCR